MVDGLVCLSLLQKLDKSCGFLEFLKRVELKRGRGYNKQRRRTKEDEASLD